MNYSFLDFVRSLFVPEWSDAFRKKSEAWLSDYYGRPVMFTAAGRSALYYILLSLPQHKVYVPAYTCSVVAEAVALAGKAIHYVASSPGEFNANCFEGLDGDSIVVATHQFGYPCAIKEIARACRQSNAVLVEDCAAAIGTRIDGQLAGTFGDYAFISFNHSKQITLPRGGGGLIAKSSALMDRVKVHCNLKYDRARSLKNRRFALICLLINNSLLYRIFHSRMIAPYEEAEQKSTFANIPSEKSPLYDLIMDDWQACLLYAQLKRMNKYNARRAWLFRLYKDAITNASIELPYENDGADYSRFAIQVKGVDKYSVYRHCVEQGVDLDFSHSHLTCPASFSNEHNMANRILDLPFYYKLSDKEARKVVRVLNSIRQHGWAEAI